MDILTSIFEIASELLSQRSLIVVAILVALYFLFRPPGGHIYNDILRIVHPNNVNNFFRRYSFIFLFSEFLLFGIGAIFVLSESLQFPVLFVSTVYIFAVLIVAAITSQLAVRTLNFIYGNKLPLFIGLGFLTLISVVFVYSLNKPLNNGTYEGPILPENKFSWGEDILIDRDVYERLAESEQPAGRYTSCVNSWENKRKGTEEYKRATSDTSLSNSQRIRLLKSSESLLRTYRDSCKPDAEAAIYHNNAKALVESDDTVKIAVSLPISRDKNSPLESQEILLGVAAAQEEINKGGNVSIKIGIADDRTSANVTEKAKQAAQYIAEEEAEIVGVVGHFNSEAMEAASPIYKKNSLVAISPTSTAIRQSNLTTLTSSGITRSAFQNNESPLKLNEYIFRTAPNDVEAIQRLANYIKVINNSALNDQEIRSVSKIGLLYEDGNRYSNLYKNLLSQVITGRELEIVNQSGKDPCNFVDGVSTPEDVDTCIDVFRAAEADAVFFIPSTATSQYFEYSFRKTHNMVNRPTLFGGDAMYNERVISENTEGLVVAVATAPDEFPEFGDSRYFFNWRSAMSYDAVNALVRSYEIASKANSEPLQRLRRRMQQALASPRFEAFGVFGEGTVKFKDGDRYISVNLMGKMPRLVCLKKSDSSEETSVYKFDSMKANDTCPQPSS